MYKEGKEVLEVITLVAGCWAFGTYLWEGDARDRADRLQTLQLQELCQSLSETVDGSTVWNYVEPRTFDEWDAANAVLDVRIAALNDSCADVVGFIPPTREVPASLSPSHPKNVPTEGP